MIDLGILLKAFAGTLGAVAAARPILPLAPAAPASGDTESVRVPERPLAVDAQWDRTAESVALTIEGARRMTELHVGATRQLDAVDYAYTRMLDELAAVMPALAAGRRDNPGLALPVSASMAETTTPPILRAIDRAA
ncbi:MAG: hypothetical protein NW217_01780 [Hyphomicrobiaceae bacterium]|nr:hypothetical protein [Hyphomicrobiaceae bacterium]